MKIVVLDADTFGRDLDLSPLSEFGTVEVYPASAPSEIASRLQGADAAVLNKVRMNAQTLGEHPTVRLVCVFATGYDNIDLAFCRAHGIAVCNVVGYSTDSVAQLTAAMALDLTLRLSVFRSYVADGSYSVSGVANRLTPCYHEIAGKTWGIAGYGHIGRAVGKIAEALGCHVIAYKRTPAEDAETVSLDELCRRSDILSVHLPLNDGTRGLFSAEKIALMKKDAILINVARGAVTDEAAVAKAILEGRLGAFGCDVYSAEPFPASHPFDAIKALPNVLLTPHMAWGAVEARVRCLSEICENIRSFLAGGTRCRVDPH